MINLNELPSLRQVEVREGVFLRPMVADDAAAIMAILEADPTIRRRVSVASKQFSEDDVRQEVAAYKADPGMVRYVIIEHGRCVGLVSLWRDNGYFGEAVNPNRYGFGYFLDPAARGRGLVVSSIQALMKVAEADLGVEEYISFCEDDNPSSARVLELAGLKRTEETFQEPATGWTERKYAKKLRK